MNVAVVGGGIFGVSAALRLAPDHTVSLFEQHDDLLQSASGINQYRLHRGYHYPRSDETARAAIEGEPAFLAQWGAALLPATRNYYAIAREQSKTSAPAFTAFLDRLGLAWREEWPAVLAPEAVVLAVRAEEQLLDPAALRALAWERLRASPVDLCLGRRVTLADLEGFDQVVVATYASLNGLLPEALRQPFQFEVCEKIVIDPGPAFDGLSVVVLDGPFMCIDPFGRTGHAVLGNVVHAIHHTNVGAFAEIPPQLAPLLDRGVIAAPPLTKFHEFIASTVRYLPALAAARYVGSMFTVRTVLPGRDATDERPTLVRRVDARTVTVFSGKIVNCVAAADEIAALLGG